MANPRLQVATRKGLFTFERNGRTWVIDEFAFEGVPVSITLTDPRNGFEFAALDHGHFGVKLHRRKPGGEWQEIAAPRYPEGATVSVRPEGDPSEATGPPATKPASLSEIWCLEAGGADQPGRLWAGTIPGGLFRSDDDGDSWQLVESLWNQDSRHHWFGGGKDDPGIHSICVDPRDSRHVTLAISCGGVWTTRDTGDSWTVVGKGLRAEYMPPDQADNPVAQDPHRMVHCSAEPDKAWIQHHNGIFRSADGGENWEEIENVDPSTFGFAVAVHPEDGNQAWFVPGVKDEMRIPAEGRLVVTRTTDGGQSFAKLTDGLPQENAYDIVFRHALDIDASGQRLAMGSTTGNFWISEDGGDHWETISNHLPPVYAVRFVG